MTTRHPDRSSVSAGLVPVRTLEELDWLVKESEVLTGQSGREFMVGSADTQTFLVQFDEIGYAIQRLGDAGSALCASAHDLVHHALGSALLRGQLFTSPVQTP